MTPAGLAAQLERERRRSKAVDASYRAGVAAGVGMVRVTEAYLDFLRRAREGRL